MVSILDTDPKISIVYCFREDFGEIRRKISTFDWESEVKILENNYLSYASMYRREVWSEIGGYDPIVSRLGGMEDYDFWRRAYKAGFKGQLLPEYYFLYRIRKGQMSEGTTKNREKILEYIKGKDKK
jgi:GT2 family glycosyltransferase